MIKVCANCKNKLGRFDKYCRYCGAPKGEGIYIVERFAMIYGPPFDAVHECEKCGYTWKNSGLGSDEQGWCPKCGGKAPAKYE